jgi:DNA-binding response OmpR family regulator
MGAGMSVSTDVDTATVTPLERGLMEALAAAENYAVHVEKLMHRSDGLVWRTRYSQDARRTIQTAIRRLNEKLVALGIELTLAGDDVIAKKI